MLSKIARNTMRAASQKPILGAASAFHIRFMSTDGYGSHVFKGAAADKYLSKQGLSAGVLDDYSWTSKSADSVAAAMLEWCQDNGVTHYCHWFQPLAAAGVRPGQSGQVQNAFLKFEPDGTASQQFKGKTLLKGETDGSSFPNGGLRATHTAGGYTVLDPTSPCFIKGDVLHIPSCFVSWYGDALDEKTPLIRASRSLSTEGKRLLKNMGMDTPGILANIGLEQEYFLISREAFYTREDLQMAGRTVMGRDAPRGQEMCDHYMAPPNNAAQEFARQVQEECWNLGIPLNTRHREVAPNQYEFAPLFGSVTTQTDQNLLVMQIMEEVAAQRNLACLLQEKPFAGINGSGKHNNWSLWTECGKNLLDPEEFQGDLKDVFPVVMAALVRGIDLHGDLMRMSIASPGNDFRLGACEAPPAIMSTYLGDDMTNFMMAYKDGKHEAYNPGSKTIDLGIPAIDPFTVPAEDRNRTSPFPYGGKRFEFRAVGSAQNVSMVNTCLAAIAAESFAFFSDAIEAGANPADVAAEALSKHSRVIFNGNGYSEEWPVEAAALGLEQMDSGVEAIERLNAPKNIELFSKLNIMSEAEVTARAAVMHDHYSGFVEMEALAMVSMINTGIIPAVAGSGLDTSELETCVSTLNGKLSEMHAAADEYSKATLARELRLEVMEEVRAVCDGAEGVVPKESWPMATYKDLLFLDSHQDADGN